MHSFKLLVISIIASGICGSVATAQQPTPSHSTISGSGSEVIAYKGGFVDDSSFHAVVFDSRVGTFGYVVTSILNDADPALRASLIEDFAPTSPSTWELGPDEFIVESEPNVYLYWNSGRWHELRRFESSASRSTLAGLGELQTSTIVVCYTRTISVCVWLDFGPFGAIFLYCLSFEITVCQALDPPPTAAPAGIVGTKI